MKREVEMYGFPIIKSFIIHNNYFYYDYVSNYIYKITKEQYAEIQMLNKVGFDSYLKLKRNTIEYNDVIRLIRAHKINGTVIETLDHQFTDECLDIASRCISKLQLQVTRNCNFNCRYCTYTRQSHIGRIHEEINMNWNIARSAIDFLFEHSTDVNEVFVNFYGGEPFLNFSLIKSTTEYAKNKFLFKKINFAAITNGSIMSQQIIDFLIENDFVLIISFDGDAEIQNRHRKFLNDNSDTYAIIYRNIQNLRKTSQDYFDRNVKFNAVKFLDENSQKIYDYFYKEFGKQHEMVNIINADMQGVDYNYSIYNLVREVKNKMIVYDKQDQALENFKTIYSDKRYVKNNWVYRANCIPGSQHLLVNVFGDFYPCEKVPEIEITKVGDIKRGFDFNRVQKMLNIHAFACEDCKKCWAIRYCKMCICHCIDPITQNISINAIRKNCRDTKNETLDMFKKIIEGDATNE